MQCKRGSATLLHLLYTSRCAWYLTCIFPLNPWGSVMRPLYGYQRGEVTCPRPHGGVVRTETQPSGIPVIIVSPASRLSYKFVLVSPRAGQMRFSFDRNGHNSAFMKSLLRFVRSTLRLQNNHCLLFAKHFKVYKMHLHSLSHHE